MEELTETQVAGRANVSPDEVRRLVTLGILAPREGGLYTDGDVRRVRLAEACESGGLPLDAIGTAIREGRLSLAFMDLPSYHRWSPHAATTFRELAHETGVPLDLLQSMHETLGMARPLPEDPIREGDLDLIPLLQASRAAGIDDGAVEQLLRVAGLALRRVAQAEQTLHNEHVEAPILERGLGQREMMQMAAEVRVRLAPLMDRALMAVYHRQQEHAWLEDTLDDVESVLEAGGVLDRAERPPAMCFLDLSGYTALTEERGDRAAAQLAASLASIVQHTAQSHGGRPVKYMGDGVMFHFRDPARAVVSALEMVERTPTAGLPPAHVGLDAGPIVYQDGDYFGRTVNVASRISAEAGPNQVLVTERVVRSGGRDGVRFTEVGPMDLKGVSQPVVLYEASRG